MRLKKVLICFGLTLLAGEAHAITTLKQVQVTDGSRVDVFFDRKIEEKQIQTEFLNDIIQLSLDDVSVYPAKISSVSGSHLTKVFAYQYTPKLVRFRLSVKGKAEDYKNRVSLKANGKILSIRIDGGSGRDSENEASPSQASVIDHSPAARAAQAQGSDEPKLASDEKALLDRVMRSQAAPAQPAGKNAPAAKPAAQLQLGGGKPLPSPMRSFMWLVVTMGCFGALAFAVKKWRERGAGPMIGDAKPAILGGALGRFARNALKKNGKMIEVVATHYLGPKKSIAVVKVGGRLLVLGVANESINLITQLPAEGANADDVLSSLGADALDDLGIGPAAQAPNGSGAMAAGNAIFADLLRNEQVRAPQPAYQAQPGYPMPAAAVASAAPSSSVRAQIRSRVEGMKRL